MTKKKQNKKKHHVIPVTYLKGFGDKNGKIYAYRKDDPENHLHVLPRNIGYINRYYSQPVPGGGWDHNAIEDFFDKETESKWPQVVSIIRNQENIEPWLASFFSFIGALRVRVPAARDSAEQLLADGVMATARTLDELGRLPPRPEGFEDILDHVEVAIDPHQSIHAMYHMLQGFTKLVDKLGFVILCNETRLPILTSDNPVIYYDPDITEKKLQPYSLKPDIGRIEFLFPIDPWHVLYGHSDLQLHFAGQGLGYEPMTDVKDAARINRFVSRFAYEYVFASSKGQEEIVSEFAHHSPVLRTEVIPQYKGSMLVSQMVFGARRRKPKWKPKLHSE